MTVGVRVSERATCSAALRTPMASEVTPML